MSLRNMAFFFLIPVLHLPEDSFSALALQTTVREDNWLTVLVTGPDCEYQADLSHMVR